MEPCMIDRDGSVEEYLANLTRSSRGRLVRNPSYPRVIFRGDLSGDDLRGKVAVISGGGSGHEPAFAGYVGPGLLSAAVCGNLFASPPVSDVLGAMKGIRDSIPDLAGILLVIMNYTGDRLNFGLALERFKSFYPGISAEMIVVEDDYATAKDRRGVAGTILALKIAGAMAALGKSLPNILQFISTKVLPNLATIGLSLSSLRLPGRTVDSFELPPGKMELGTGIHGEAGAKRIKLHSSRESVEIMLQVLSEREIKRKESIVLLVNNLGGMSQLEIGVAAGEAVNILEEKDLKVERLYSGSFMTSLRMAGFSCTILRLGVARDEALGGIPAKTNPEIIKYLDAYASSVAWTGAQWTSENVGIKSVVPIIKEEIESENKDPGPKLESIIGRDALDLALKFVTEALISCEGQLNIMDTGAGDGDTGTTMKNGAEAISKLLEKKELKSAYPINILKSLSCIAEKEMGGTSGALYSIFFSAVSGYFQKKMNLSFPSYVEALEAGVKAISKYGNSRPGDRTMLDALDPYVKSFLDSMKEANLLLRFDQATSAAEDGAVKTLKMRPNVGRAARVSLDEIKHPDPGAHAVGIICRAINEAVKKVSTSGK